MRGFETGGQISGADGIEIAVRQARLIDRHEMEIVRRPDVFEALKRWLGAAGGSCYLPVLDLLHCESRIVKNDLRLDAEGKEQVLAK